MNSISDILMARSNLQTINYVGKTVALGWACEQKLRLPRGDEDMIL
jgi:hypothetical protein